MKYVLIASKTEKSTVEPAQVGRELDRAIDKRATITAFASGLNITTSVKSVFESVGYRLSNHYNYRVYSLA